MMETQTQVKWHQVSSLEELSNFIERAEGVCGIYVPLNTPFEVYDALQEYQTQNSEVPLLLPIKHLESLWPLMSQRLTVKAPHAPLPGVVMKSARMLLSLATDCDEAGGIMARALYELLAHMPSTPPVGASWYQHQDGVIDATLKGENWSFRITLQKGEVCPLGEVGHMRLTATTLDHDMPVQLEVSLNPAPSIEDHMEWNENRRIQWRRALGLLERAMKFGQAQLPIQAQIHPSAQLHPTVDVTGSVVVGAQTKVWHFSKLLGPLEIGSDCNLGQNVVVERHAQLGRNVKIQNNVSIYSGVVLEDDVFCGPSMVFTNVGTPRSHYPRRGSYEETRVKQGASIGANATVVCGSTIGRYALIGAGAVVTKDIPDYALAFGNPARVQGWVCYCGEGLALGRGVQATVGSAEAHCEECGRTFVREGLQVSERSKS